MRRWFHGEEFYKDKADGEADDTATNEEEEIYGHGPREHPRRGVRQILTVKNLVDRPAEVSTR